MAYPKVNLGDSPKVSVAFTDDGDAADPDAVTLLYQPPGGAVVSKVYGTDVEVVKDSTGNYHAFIPATTAGLWKVRWVGVGTVDAGVQVIFETRSGIAVSS